MALRRTRGSAQSNLRRVASLLANSDSAAAKDLCTHVCKNNRGHVQAWSTLAGIHAQRNEREEAARCWRRITTLQPDSARAHNNLGVALEALGRPASAVDSYLKGLSLDPSAAQIHFNLGNACFDLHDPDRAALAYAQALQL